MCLKPFDVVFIQYWASKSASFKSSASSRTGKNGTKKPNKLGAENMTRGRYLKVTYRYINSKKRDTKLQKSFAMKSVG